MNPADELSAPTSARFGWPWLTAAVVALAIAFLFFRAPEPASSGNNSSYRMLLDLAFRPSAAATLPVQTLDGPLMPLQNPVYVGRSIWRALVWQIAANLIMAWVMAATIVRLPATRAWFAAVLFVVFGISESTVAPWITIFLLACWVTRSDRPSVALMGGIGLGVLATTAIAHFLFGVGALALLFFRRSENARPRIFGVGGFLLGLLATWLVLEQPFSKLGAWLWFGFTKAWTPSSLVIPSASVSAYTWIAIAFAVWLTTVFFRRAFRGPGFQSQSVLLVTWGLFLAWKLIAVQPGGSPLVFFATVMLGGFLFLPVAPGESAALFVIGVLGAATPDRTLMSDAVGRINRQVLRNLDELRELGSLRTRLRQDLTGYGASFATPQTRSTLGGGDVGVIGDSAMPVILNGLPVTFAPGFGSVFERDDRAARDNAAALLRPNAPEFLLHRLDRDSDLLPSLRDGPAQLALYENYDFILHEQGMSLWKKRLDQRKDPPTLVKTGTVRFGEKIDLPLSTEPYWIELDCSPNWIGLMRDQLRPLIEPALRLENLEGNQLRYALPWRMARAGFLVQPFWRGEIDVLKFEEGQPPPQLRSVIVELPEFGHRLWRPEISYRLYHVRPFVSAAKNNLAAPLRTQFSAINRLPISFFCPFPPLSGLILAKPAVFLHPSSAMEIVATAEDRVLQGSFGIAPNAYTGLPPNVTDGVSFSIEFLPASGTKILLLQRNLDPTLTEADRGPQPFTIKLPPSSGGRLVFRTFNLPQKTSSFDWSYWREIELK